EFSFFKQVPSMTSRNIIQAPIFHGSIIEARPASQMLHRIGSGPIAVILMPGNHASMLSWLGEQLIMPEPNGFVTEQLGSWHYKTRIPKHIVETFGDSPMTQGMK